MEAEVAERHIGLTMNLLGTIQYLTIERVAGDSPPAVFILVIKLCIYFIQMKCEANIESTNYFFLQNI